MPQFPGRDAAVLNILKKILEKNERAKAVWN